MTTKIFENNQSQKWKISIRSLLIAVILSLVFTAVSFAEGGGRYQLRLCLVIGRPSGCFGLIG